MFVQGESSGSFRVSTLVDGIPDAFTVNLIPILLIGVGMCGVPVDLRAVEP